MTRLRASALYIIFKRQSLLPLSTSCVLPRRCCCPLSQSFVYNPQKCINVLSFCLIDPLALLLLAATLVAPRHGAHSQDSFTFLFINPSFFSLLYFFSPSLSLNKNSPTQQLPGHNPPTQANQTQHIHNNSTNMATSTSPVIRARNAKYQANVTKRGQTKTSAHAEKKVAKKPTVSPMLVGCILLMLCGGAIFEVLRLFGASTEPSF